MLAEPVSQQSVARAAQYLLWQAALVPPLSRVLSVIMTQIVSTLASLLQGAWHPSQHCTHSSLTTCSRRTCCMSWFHCSPRTPDTAAFLAVFSPLVQHCQQEAPAPT